MAGDRTHLLQSIQLMPLISLAGAPTSEDGGQGLVLLVHEVGDGWFTH